MNKELYINDKLIELDSDGIVALTKQMFDLSSLESRNGSYSNQIKIPYTINNHKVLGNSNNFTSGSRLPYTRLSIKYVDCGVEIIPTGFGVIDTADGYYELTIYTDNSDVFDLIDSRQLTDLDFSDFDHIWYYNSLVAGKLGIIQYNTSTDGVIYPLIDYGFMNQTQSSVSGKELFPAIFIHTIIKRIFDAIGYSLQGDILTDEMYLNLLVAWSKNKWANGDDLPEETTEDATSGAQTMHLAQVGTSSAYQWTDEYFASGYFAVPPLTPQGLSPIIKVLDNTTTVIFENELNGDIQYGNFKQFLDISGQNSTSWVNPLPPSLVNVSATCNFRYTSGFTTDTGGEYDYSFILTKTNTLDETITQIGSQTVAVHFAPGLGGGGSPQGVVLNDLKDIYVGEDEYLSLNIFINQYHRVSGSGAPQPFTVDIIVDSVDFNVVHQGDIFETGVVQMTKQLPDISQSDFLKGILNVFGLIIDSTSKNKTAIFRKFKDINKNLSKAKIWGHRSDGKYEVEIEEGTEILSYRIGSYSQRNKLTWNVDQYTTNELGTAYFFINDTTLNTGLGLNENPAISLPFGSSDMVNRLQPNKVYVPLIEKLKTTNDVVTNDKLELNDTSIRLVMLDRQNDAHGVIYNQSGGALPQYEYTDLPYCYFSLPLKPFNLDWNNLVQLGYQEILEILENFKMLTVMVNLKGRDIQSFDYLTAIYIPKYAKYFYVNKIADFKEGQLTQVELIKL